MSTILRRLYSSLSRPSPVAPATAIASQFLAHSQSLAPHKHTQLLDANQVQRLSATLSRTEFAQSPPKNGTPLPPCHHLVYFTPCQVEEYLGPDGTDTSFNPPEPFTRRMWAGGELEWIQGTSEGLKVGQEVVETTKLVSAEGKRTRAGEEMVIVGVKKEYANENGIVLVDKRNWIFRPQITISQSYLPKLLTKVPLPSGTHTRDFLQTPVSLFRFSALTFNGHKIHYNKEWCQNVEGHRDLVVHGPLNLIHIVDFWRDVNGVGLVPKKVNYRATGPIYVGERYRVVLDDEVGGVTEVKVVDSFGGVGMVGRIERA